MFLPLLTLQGLEGKLFAPVALTIIFALASSLLLSLTLIPVLSSLLLKQARHDEPGCCASCSRPIEPALAWRCAATARRRVPWRWLMLAGGARRLHPGRQDLHADDGRGRPHRRHRESCPSISLEQTAALDLKHPPGAHESHPGVTGVVARAGSDEIGLDPMGLNETDTFLVLKPRGEWQVREQGGADGPDPQGARSAARHRATASPSRSTCGSSEMIIGVRGDLAIKVFGPDLDQLNELAGQHRARSLKQVPGNQDVYTVANDGVQYLRVVIDRWRRPPRPVRRGCAGRAARADRGPARGHRDRAATAASRSCCGG